MNTIQVSQVDPRALGTPGIAERYLAWLDDAERDRYQRYVFDEHRMEYLAGCVMAKKRIAALVRSRPEEVLFRRDRWGRPHILSPGRGAHIRFSISHTKGCAVCAVSALAEIGIDVERTDRPAGQLPVSLACLSEAEMSDILARDGAALSARFAQYWTLKEAYTKAVGRGLSIPFDRITFSLAAGADPAVSFDGVDDDPSRWSFKAVPLGASHVLSLAFLSSIDATLAFSRWHPVDDVFIDEPQFC